MKRLKTVMHRTNRQALGVRTAMLTFTAMLIACAMAMFTTVTAQAAVPSQPGWTLQFSDDFNGAAGTGLNTSNWLYDTGTGFGTGEIETMTNSTNNVFQDGNGNLVIRALKDANGNWTSGRIESVNDSLQAPPGGMLKVQASIELPNLTGAAAQGYWPAFWMLGTPIRTGANTWPNGGEVDIMEDVNGQNTDYSHLHCGTDPGGPCNEPSGIGGSISGMSPSVGSGFHTYTMVYDRSVSPEQIRFYIDGNNFYTINANQVDSTTWDNAMHHGFYIIFDLAMGGGWPGNPTSSTVSGGEMKVDYVAAWTQSGSGSGSGGGTTGGQSGTGNGYSYNIASSGSNSAQVTFTPTSSMQYVILHYTVNGGAQQNVNMTEQSNGSWTYNIPGVNSGNTIQYSFTYSNGTQTDSPSYSWTDSNTSSGGGSSGGSSIVSGADYVLVNPNSNMALDVAGAGTSNYTNVDIYQQNGTPAQVWQINKNADGTYSLVNPNSNMALDAYAAGTADGTNVDIYTQNGTAAQKWNIVSNGDGTYTLVNVNSNKALDVYSAGTTNGTNVDIWTQNGTPAQKWVLDPTS